MLYRATRRGYIGFDAHSADAYGNRKYIITSKGREIVPDVMEIVPQFFNVVDDFAQRHKYFGMNLR
jgi:DNA-binding PadR family transcriptional regulator